MANWLTGIGYALSGAGATVAQKLSEQEVQALSSYLQGLHNKADDVATATPSAQPAAAP